MSNSAPLAFVIVAVPAFATSIGGGRAIEAGVDLTVAPPTFDDFVKRFLAAPVKARGLAVKPLTGEDNPTGADVVELDRSDSVFVFASIAPGSIGAATNKTFPRAEHPLIRTHPVTKRKSIFVNPSYTTHLEGVSKEEGDAILNYLYLHCMNPNFQCRFRWAPNSVAFWDNRCTQHHAMFDYFPHRRYGHRVTVCGDKPFYRASQAG